MHSIATTVTARLRTSPKKPAFQETCTVWVWPPVTTTVTAFQIFMSHNTAEVFCITTMAMAPSQMSPQKPVLLPPAGLPALSGSTTTMMVANDTVANCLFANRQGQFEEIGLVSGVGYSPYGRPRSGMGVDAADYDQDGWVDLFVANVDQEMFSLYHNNRDESFRDVALPTGIASATKLLSGWGLKFFDFDNDGDMDLLLCNVHADDRIDGRV